MIISSVTVPEVLAKDTLLPNSYLISHTDYLDQFSNLEYHAFNHFGPSVLRDQVEIQLGIVLGMRRGSISSLPANYTEVIA